MHRIRAGCILFGVGVMVILLIGTLTGIGSNVLAAIPNGSDKILHGCAHGILVVAVVYGFDIHTNAGKALVWTVSTAIGGLVEVMQMIFTTDRKPDVLDAFAAAVGSSVVWIVYPRQLCADESRCDLNDVETGLDGTET